MFFREFLDEVHNAMRPRRYVEIGVRHGDSLALAFPGTRIVAIDPKPDIRAPVPHAKLFRMTSDDYFTHRDLVADLGGVVDLSLIHI